MFENKVNVDNPSKIQFDLELTDPELTRLTKLAGNDLKIKGFGAYDTLNNIMAGKHPMSGQWAKATDGPEGGRAFIIRTVVSIFRDAAREQLLRDNKELKQRVNKRIREKRDAFRGFKGFVIPRIGTGIGQ